MHRFRPESLPAKIDSSIPKEFTLKNTIVVWSRVIKRHAGVEPTCCWFWIKKTKRGTPQIHRPRCYYITRKFFMQAEKSRSGANDFFPVENILIHTVFNAKGWNKRLILLYHAALFHANNRKPPTSATIDGSLRKDFRINFNFDSESTKTNFAITTATQSPFVFDYGARAPRRHVSSHSQQWIGSCHSITRRCRRGYFFEYE